MGRRSLMPALVSFAAAVGATAWIVSRSAADIGTALTFLAPPIHLFALAAFGVELVARGARVAWVARGLGLPLRLSTSIRAQLSGDAAGAVTPSRVGSDPAKIVVLQSDGAGLGSCGALLVAEMGAEAGVLLLCAVAMLFGPWSPWWSAGIASYALTVSALGSVAFLVSRVSGAEPPRLWMRVGLGAGRWKVIQSTTRDFRRDARRLRDLRPARIVAVLTATLVHIGARVAILPLLVLPAGGLASIPLPSEGLAPLVVRPFAVLYGSALLPPPGGGGGVEIAFATSLGDLLQPQVLAAALLWWRVYTFYLGAILGGLLIVARRLRAEVLRATRERA